MEELSLIATNQMDLEGNKISVRGTPIRDTKSSNISPSPPCLRPPHRSTPGLGKYQPLYIAPVMINWATRHSVYPKPAAAIMMIMQTSIMHCRGTKILKNNGTA